MAAVVSWSLVHCPGALLTYFNDGGGEGGVRVIFLGRKFWPKVIFLGLWKTPGFFLGCKRKTEGFFWVAKKELRDFLGYAKKSTVYTRVQVEFFGHENGLKKST